jgi:hypothetical protein
MKEPTGKLASYGPKEARRARGCCTIGDEFASYIWQLRYLDYALVAQKYSFSSVQSGFDMTALRHWKCYV